MLNRALYLLTMTVAVTLLLVLAVTPLLADSKPTHGWQRLLELFAQDDAIRHTSVGCAIGLVITAQVFFRSMPKTADKDPSGTTVIGA